MVDINTNILKDEDDFLELPAIDMQAPESEIVPKVIEMFSTIGFLHIKNIEGYDEQELLKTCKAFHAIPKEEKVKLYLHHHNKNNPNIFRGM